MSPEHPSESPQPVIDREPLHVVQDTLISAWKQLRPEHQVGMTLVMLDTLIGTEQGSRLRETIEKRWPIETETPGEFFPVTRISRQDLEHLRFSEDEIAQLDDNDMRMIARKMEDYYVTGEFWGDLEFVARKILARHGAHIRIRSHEAIGLDPRRESPAG